MDILPRCAAVYVAAFTLSATGCAHPGAKRDVVPGERISLDAVTFDAPAESGWKLSDEGEGYRRYLVLRHEVAGKWDRYVAMHELPMVAPPPTPADLLRETRRVIGSSRMSVQDEGVGSPSIDERFGPFSVTWSRRTASAPRGAGVPSRTTAVRAYHFIAPLRLDRHYVAEYGERGEAIGPEFEEHARSAFGGIKLAPAPPEGAGRFHEGQPRGSIYMQVTGGVAPFELRGDSRVGFCSRVGVGAFALARGSDRGSGQEYGFITVAATSARRAVAAFAFSPRAFAVRGPIRIGAGLDLGLEERRDFAASRPSFGFVVGPNGFASVDLRDRAGMALYLEVEAGAATPGFFRAVASIGLRTHLAPW